MLKDYVTQSQLFKKTLELPKYEQSQNSHLSNVTSVEENVSNFHHQLKKSSVRAVISKFNAPIFQIWFINHSTVQKKNKNKSALPR